MEYVTLGKTGREVSRLGFGGATAGLKDYLDPFDPAKHEDSERVINAIRRAYELGVNYFDTAAGYGDGASEWIYGSGLQGIASDELFIATKAAPCNADEVRRSVEESLKNLKRDYVDLLQIHGGAYTQHHVDMVLRADGMLDELEKMRDEGLIRHLGFTVESQDKKLYALLDTERFDVLQIQYNLMFSHPYDPSRDSGSIYSAEELGLGIVTMRSTTSGTLQKWIRMVNPDNTFDYTQALIQYNLSCPLVDVVLVGMRDVSIVEANVSVVENTGGRIDLDELFTRYV